MRTIESRERIQNYIFLVVTITTNVINLFACMTFILQDYFEQLCENNDPPSCDDDIVLTVIEKSDLTFAFIFILELFYNFYYSSRPKYTFFLKKDTFVDIVTISPPIVNLILESKVKIGFLRILRVIKVIRIVRIFKILKMSSSSSNDESSSKREPMISPLKNQIIMLILNLLTTIFIAAGIIMFVDNIQPGSFNVSMQFIDAIYYMIITSGTIGYGDFYPATSLSRIVLVIIIVMIISVFGNQISALTATIKEVDFYDTQYKLKGHIVIIGSSVKTDIIARFLMHFYQHSISPASNGYPTPNGKEEIDNQENLSQQCCLIIGDTRINPKLKRLLSYTFFDDKVFYLSVKAIDTTALLKGNVHQCAAIFYLSNQYTNSPDAHDKKAMFINQFLLNNGIKCNIYLGLCMTDQMSFIRQKFFEEEIEWKTLKYAINLMNNINHGYKGKYFIKCILIGVKKQINSQHIYPKNPSMLFYQNSSSQQWPSSQSGCTQDYSSSSQEPKDAFSWYHTSEFSTFDRANTSYIINQGNHIIQYGEQALILAAGDDIIQFFSDQNTNEILQYENYDLFWKEKISHYISVRNNERKIKNRNSPNKFKRRETQSSQQTQNQTNEDHLYSLQTLENQTLPTQRNMLSKEGDYSYLNKNFNERFKQIESQEDKKQIKYKSSKVMPVEAQMGQLPRQNHLQMAQNIVLGRPTIDETSSENSENSEKEQNTESSRSIEDNESFSSYNNSDKSETLEQIESDSDTETQNYQLQIKPSRSAQRKKKQMKKEQYRGEILNNVNSKLDQFILQGHYEKVKNLYNFKCNLTQRFIDFTSGQCVPCNLLTNHIIVCGGNSFGLEYLIEQIRRYSDTPICLLNQDIEIESNFQRMIAKYPYIFFFKGDPLNSMHLKNANIRQCQLVLVLCSKQDEFQMSDSRSILIAQLIKELFPRKKVLTEIKEITNLCLIEDPIGFKERNTNLHLSYFLSKELMSGRIFFSQQLDIITSQLALSPHLIKLFHLMTENPFQINFLSEDGTITNQNGNINNQGYSQKFANSSEISRSTTSMTDSLSNQNLISLKVPPFIYGQSYWKLFQELLEHKNYILIGIYTRNALMNEQNTQQFIEEVKNDFNKHQEYENEQHRKESPMEEFKRKNQSNIDRKKSFLSRFSSKLDSGTNFQKSTKPDEDDWFDIDINQIQDNLPLLIINPPIETELKKGDYILALGSLQKNKLREYLNERSSKSNQMKKNSKRHIDKLLDTGAELYSQCENDTLKSILEEINLRANDVSFKISLLKDQNLEVIQLLNENLGLNTNDNQP